MRTTLQRVVQLLKLHRDTILPGQPPTTSRPPFVITTLATHAYGGDSDLFEALPEGRARPPILTSNGAMATYVGSEPRP